MRARWASTTIHPVGVRVAFACVLGLGLVACGSGSTVAQAGRPVQQAQPVGDTACDFGDDPLYYTARPRLVTAAPAGAEAVRLRFEVYEQDAGEASPEHWRLDPYEPQAVAYAKATAGARTSWVPAEPLEEGMHAWRARPEAKGKPVGGWSPWREFTINTTMTRVHECRVGAAVIEQTVSWAGHEGTSVEKALYEAAFQEGIVALINAIQERFPADYAGAVLDNERGSGWVAFKDAVPSGAEKLIAEYRAGGGAIEVRDHRGFSENDLAERSTTACGAISDLEIVDGSSGGPDPETGVLELEVGKAAGTRMTDKEFRQTLLEAIRKASTVRIVPWAKGARATVDTQPVRIDVGPPGPRFEPQ